MEFSIRPGECGAITRAIARIAREMGVEILLNEPVERVLVENGEAIGLKTERRALPADAVVINADFAGAMQQMVPNHLRKRWKDKTLAKKDYSCSTFMMYLGVDGCYDDVLKDIETLHRLSENPSFYVQNASVTDSHLHQKERVLSMCFSQYHMRSGSKMVAL